MINIIISNNKTQQLNNFGWSLATELVATLSSVNKGDCGLDYEIQRLTWFEQDNIKHWT